MDCRDIKEEPLEIIDGQYLEEIYKLQKGLLDHYVGIEGLPPYPVDVNTKASQTLLKDFTGRVTEELAEGFESYVYSHHICISKNYFNPDMFDEGDCAEAFQRLLSHIQNFNEEMADAMHFMVELLIYANIQPEDIDAYISNVSSIPSNIDVMNRASLLGKDVFSEIIPTGYRHFKPQELIDAPNPLLLGGSSFSDVLLEASDRLLWRITFELNMARNCLKNKPWKQTGVMTNEVLYQECLVKAFIALLAYLSMMGLESKDIYYLYFKKNMVNQFRIKSKY